MTSKSRRRFLGMSTAALATTCAAPAVLRARNVNDRIRVAVVGMGGRAQAHARSLIDLEQDGSQEVDFVGICDCDQTKLNSAVKAWSDRAGHKLAGYDDMRRVLDDDSIDAVTFATPNHWHALNVM